MDTRSKNSKQTSPSKSTTPVSKILSRNVHKDKIQKVTKSDTKHTGKRKMKDSERCEHQKHSI